MAMSSSIVLRWICSKKAAARNLWSSSAAWLMLAPSVEKGKGYNYFYSVGQEKVIRLKQGGEEEEGALLVGSSHGWVALYKERERLLYLSNPITGEHMKLPPLPDKYKHRGVEKVILSCPPHHHDCRAAMTLGNGCLSLCTPGRSTAWITPVPDRTVTHLEDGLTRSFPVPYEDFVFAYSRKNTPPQLLCLLSNSRNELEGWDLSNPINPRMEWSEKLGDFDLPYPLSDPARSGCYSRRYIGIGCSFRRYLVHVDHTDQLLQVTRYFVYQMAPDGYGAEDLEDLIHPSKTIAFDVHLIDRRRRKRTYVEGSLGGLALFVGRNHSLALPAAHFPGLHPDSIYFTDANKHTLDEELYGGHDIGIFDYNKHTISSCYYPCHYSSFKKILPMPIWFTPTPHYYY